MLAFYAAKRLRKPEDIIPFLAKKEAHWREGYSAYELAYAWMSADGFPPRIKAVLDTVPGLAGTELVQAWFEKETDLRTPGRDSQTDLLVHARAPAGDFLIAVEGKVDESLGPLVSEWKPNSTPGRSQRLAALCAMLELTPALVGGLRYQLFHRTASAIIEAQAFGFAEAVMLVHSFSSTKRWLADFHGFAAALGIEGNLDGQLSGPIERGGVNLRLGWVSDTRRKPLGGDVGSSGAAL